MSIQIAQPYLLLLQQIYPNLCCCKPEMTLKIFVFTKKRRIIELKNNVFCLLEMSVKWNPNSCLKFCGLWLNNFPRFIKNFLVDTQYYKWHYTYSTLCAKRALFNLKSVWNRQLHSAWLKNTHCDLTIHGAHCCPSGALLVRYFELIARYYSVYVGSLIFRQCFEKCSFFSYYSTRQQQKIFASVENDSSIWDTLYENDSIPPSSSPTENLVY